MRFGPETKARAIEAETNSGGQGVVLRLLIDSGPEKPRWVEANIGLREMLGRESAGWHNGGPRPDVKLRFLPVGYQPEDQGQDQQPEDKPEPAPAKRKARPKTKRSTKK